MDTVTDRVFVGREEYGCTISLMDLESKLIDERRVFAKVYLN